MCQQVRRTDVLHQPDVERQAPPDKKGPQASKESEASFSVHLSGFTSHSKQAPPELCDHLEYLIRNQYELPFQC
jgi:hypothetical protein